MPPSTMEAIVLLEPNKYELQEVPVPEVGPDEVLCRVGAVAICGTDLGIMAGKFFPMWPPKWPFIIGHEWAGTVEAVGPGITAYAPGDKVAGSSAVGCGHCRNCMKGRYNLCLNYGNVESGHRQYGFTVDGAYAQYISVNARCVVKLPPGTLVDKDCVLPGGAQTGVMSASAIAQAACDAANLDDFQALLDAINNLDPDPVGGETMCLSEATCPFAAVIPGTALPIIPGAQCPVLP